MDWRERVLEGAVVRRMGSRMTGLEVVVLMLLEAVLCRGWRGCGGSCGSCGSGCCGGDLSAVGPTGAAGKSEMRRRVAAASSSCSAWASSSSSSAGDSRTLRKAARS